MTSVPLAITAGCLSHQWWTVVPLYFCAWWWADQRWRWTWLVAVESGAFGTMWSYSGATALAQFREYTIAVGLVWIFFALALAAVSAYNRKHNSGSFDYAGY